MTAIIYIHVLIAIAFYQLIYSTSATVVFLIQQTIGFYLVFSLNPPPPPPLALGS